MNDKINRESTNSVFFSKKIRLDNFLNYSFGTREEVISLNQRDFENI